MVLVFFVVNLLRIDLYDVVKEIKKGRDTMKTIIKRSILDYLKNPVLWIGLIIIVASMYQCLSSYLQIHYIKQNEQITQNDVALEDADVMDGYSPTSDDKERRREGHRNDMNIKYRLLCKRLIEERKRVGVIQYYNVLFIMELVSDKDIWSLEQWVNGINNIYMKDIHNWCRIHFVKYHTVFVYRKEYPVKANIWNGYSYIRWRMERMMNLG